MIKKFTQLAFIVALGAGSEAFAANYYAVANGAWSDQNTWSNTRGGLAGTGTTNSTTGLKAPGPGDLAYTEGYEILIDDNITVANLAVRSTNLAGLQLQYGGLFDPFTITITGGLGGVTSTGTAQAPLLSVIEDTPNLIFRFTNGATTAIQNWSFLAPINTVQINPSSGTVKTNAATGNLAITSELSIISGIFKPQIGIADASGSSTIFVNSTTTLDLTSTGTNVTGSGGTLGTKFNSVQIDGTVTIGTNNSLTVDNISMGASGILNVAFAGIDQTQGWWYQNNSPSTFSLATSSQINYAANAVQNIFATTYGTLSLSTTAPVTKSLVGTGLIITGNLAVGTNVTFSPSSNVIFNGSTSQAISGGGTLSFAGGLQLNKSAGTVTLSKDIAVTGGIVLTLGALDIGSQTVTMNTGNFSVTGGSLVTPSTGTVNFTGTSAISIGSTAPTFPNFTITGGSVTAPSGTDDVLAPSGSNGIRITGNFTNTGGTFNENGGLVIFNGTAVQTISGSPTTFNNVHISNATGVSLSTTTNMLGILALSSTGKITTGGNLVLKSNAQNSSSGIGNLQQPLNFSGDVTVERRVNGPDAWRYLSMPITNGNVGIWKTAFGDVTGNFSDACTAPSANVVDCTAPSLYYYDASVPGYVAVGGGLAAAGTSLSSRIGYSLYTYLPGDATISASGAIEKGPFSITGISTGYNLLPNPYPSSIDWDNMNRAGFDNTLHLRTANLIFATYVAGGSLCTGCSGFSSAWRGEIAIGQAYWVQSTGATAMPFTEAVKTTAIQTNYVRDAVAQDYVRITMSSNQQSDDAVIMFKEGTSFNFDHETDGTKRRNGDYISNLGRNNYMNLSTFTDDAEKDMAINLVPLVSCDAPTKIKFKITDVTEGQYSFKFSDMETFNVGYGITLIDNFLSTETSVANGDQYTFEITSEIASASAGRFELKFKTPTTPSITNVTSAEVCTSGSMTLQASGAPTNGSYKWYTTMDGTGLVNGASGSSLVTPVLTSTTSYYVAAVNSAGCESGRVEVKATVHPAEIPNITLQGSNLLTSSSTQGNQWFKDGAIIPGATGNTYAASESGVYTVQVTSTYGCSTTSAGRTMVITGLESSAIVGIYPNPTEGKIIINLDEETDAGLRGIYLYDMKGSLITGSDSRSDLRQRGEKQIDISDQRAGLFLLRIVSEKEVKSVKILKK